MATLSVGSKLAGKVAIITGKTIEISLLFECVCVGERLGCMCEAVSVGVITHILNADMELGTLGIVQEQHKTIKKSLPICQPHRLLLLPVG